MVSFHSNNIGIWIFNGYKTISINSVTNKLFWLINLKYFHEYTKFNMGCLGDKYYNFLYIYFLFYCGMHFIFHLFGLIFKIKKNCLRRAIKFIRNGIGKCIAKLYNSLLRCSIIKSTICIWNASKITTSNWIWIKIMIIIYLIWWRLI